MPSVGTLRSVSRALGSLSAATDAHLEGKREDLGESAALDWLRAKASM